MPGAGYVIARRGLILLFSYVMIIIIVAAVMEATGYTQRIYEAIVKESVQAEILSFGEGWTSALLYRTRAD